MYIIYSTSSEIGAAIVTLLVIKCHGIGDSTSTSVQLLSCAFSNLYIGMRHNCSLSIYLKRIFLSFIRSFSIFIQYTKKIPVKV